MSAELIGILGVGVALASLQLTFALWLDARIRRVEQRVARIEGLIEGANLFRPNPVGEPLPGN